MEMTDNELAATVEETIRMSEAPGWPDVESMLARAEQRIDAGPAAAKAQAQRTPVRASRAITRARVPLLALAGGVAIAVLALGIVTLRPKHTPSTYQTYNTATAQSAAITLKDGTRVQLAPESRLTVPDEFGQAMRIVTLTGRATFNVRQSS